MARPASPFKSHSYSGSDPTSKTCWSPIYWLVCKYFARPKLNSFRLISFVASRASAFQVFQRMGQADPKRNLVVNIRFFAELVFG